MDEKLFRTICVLNNNPLICKVVGYDEINQLMLAIYAILPIVIFLIMYVPSPGYPIPSNKINILIS